jgi:hypothetical protein
MTGLVLRHGPGPDQKIRVEAASREGGHPQVPDFAAYQFTEKSHGGTFHGLGGKAEESSVPDPPRRFVQRKDFSFHRFFFLL